MSVGEMMDIINQKAYLFPKKERKEIKASDVKDILKRGDN